MVVDPKRIDTFDKFLFRPFVVNETQPLQRVLANQQMKPDRDVLLAKVANGVIVLDKPQMAYSHTAQGQHEGQPWLVCFCVVCNSGISLIPKVDGRLYHFEYVGLYNGLAVVRDIETNSFWSHYTGECIHGQHQGYQLEILDTIQHMTAKQALARYPNAETALAKQNLFAKFFSRLMQVTSLKPKGSIPPQFNKTMAEADDRRPRLDVGLGVWDGKTARYYPLESIKTEELIVDDLSEQRLFIYIDQVSQIPAAFYSNALAARWQNGELHLDTNEVVRNGQVHTVGGEIRFLERPKQQFTRWYGFSYTFPNCEIYTC